LGNEDPELLTPSSKLTRSVLNDPYRLYCWKVG
jgi:hypothetical protein